MIALPQDSKPRKMTYPPIQVFNFAEKNYQAGIVIKKTATGSFRIYDVEKTLVDCFRYRRRLGEDVAVEGLRNYFKKGRPGIYKILSYAKESRMSNVMKPYLQTLTGS